MFIRWNPKRRKYFHSKYLRSLAEDGHTAEGAAAEGKVPI